MSCLRIKAKINAPIKTTKPIRKIMRKLTVIAFTLCFTQFVSAANMWCTGTISNIYVDSSKNVMIRGDWRNDYTRICRTDGSAGVDTVTCSLWVSLATTSMTNNKSVKLMYDDQGGAMSCNTIPTYSNAPNPAYLMLIR